MRGVVRSQKGRSLRQGSNSIIAKSMAEIRTVITLVHKRDEIRASIRMCERKIAQVRSDLAHVTAVMRLFEASDKPQDLARYVEPPAIQARASLG